jgi:hypothetical protein
MEGASEERQAIALDGAVGETPPGIGEGFGRRRFFATEASEAVSQSSRPEENAGAEGHRPGAHDRGPCQERSVLVPRVIDARDASARERRSWSSSVNCRPLEWSVAASAAAGVVRRGAQRFLRRRDASAFQSHLENRSSVRCSCRKVGCRGR